MADIITRKTRERIIQIIEWAQEGSHVTEVEAFVMKHQDRLDELKASSHKEPSKDLQSSKLVIRRIILKPPDVAS